jgi:hypothetical protein
MAAGLVVVWLMGGFGGKSADTNVTEGVTLARDHEHLLTSANWSNKAGPKRGGRKRIDGFGEADETSRTPSCGRRRAIWTDILRMSLEGRERYSRATGTFGHMTKGLEPPCRFGPRRVRLLRQIQGTAVKARRAAVFRGHEETETTV